jgi:hypothetical protein
MKGKYDVRSAGREVRGLDFSCLPACLILLFLPVLARSATPVVTNEQTTVVLVVGAPGEPEFGSNFVQQARLWEATCEQAGARTIRIGLDESAKLSDYQLLKQTLAAETTNGTDALWLVMIGHGTFDGKLARFNLRGPDVSASDLAEWLMPFRRPLVVISTASASAPFLNKLSATNRVVITATRSGFEQNYTRFGGYLAEAVSTSQSDLDQDGQTSLLEAFLAASHRVAEFYKTEGRIATEHALIDDNGDGLGTPADWFRGVHAIKKPQAGASLDGVRAHQMFLVRSPAELALPPVVRSKRDGLELDIARLREAKSQRAEVEYYRELEKLLVELARLYETANGVVLPANGHNR